MESTGFQGLNSFKPTAKNSGGNILAVEPSSKSLILLT